MSIDKISSWTDRVITNAINWLGQFIRKPLFTELSWCAAEYDVLVYESNSDGSPDLSRPRLDLSSVGHNLVTDDGRKQVLKHVLGINTPSAAVTFPFLGVGSNSTAAVETQTALLAELTGNLAGRKTLLNTSALALSDTDVVFEISGLFRWKVIAQATFAAADSNNGSIFAEYGIFSTSAYASGKMYNRFVSPSPFTKSASLAVIVNMTLRA